MGNFNAMMEEATMGGPSPLTPTVLGKGLAEYVEVGTAISYKTSILEQLARAAGPGVDGGPARAGHLLASDGAVVLMVVAKGTEPALLDLVSRLVFTSGSDQHPVVLLVSDRRSVIGYAKPGTIMPTVAIKATVMTKSAIEPTELDFAMGCLPMSQQCHDGIVVGHDQDEAFVYGGDARTAMVLAGAVNVLHHYESEPSCKVTTYRLVHAPSEAEKEAAPGYPSLDDYLHGSASRMLF